MTTPAPIGLRERTQQTAFRLPMRLLARIDEHVARLQKEYPGMRITRTDAVRVLLTSALDAAKGSAFYRR